MLPRQTLPLLLVAALTGFTPASGRLTAQMSAMESHAHAQAAPSTTLSLTGIDGKALTFSPAEIKAMPHKSVTVFNEHAKANEIYTGVLLTDLLSKAGVPTGKDLKGKAFLMYVMAEGTDHYRVLYSLDEVDGANHAGDVIVADTLGGSPLTTDGAFKLVSSEDKRPARWVRNLTAITVKSAE